MPNDTLNRPLLMSFVTNALVKRQVPFYIGRLPVCLSTPNASGRCRVAFVVKKNRFFFLAFYRHLFRMDMFFFAHCVLFSFYQLLLGLTVIKYDIFMS